MTWERITDAYRAIEKNRGCDESSEWCSSQATWKLAKYDEEQQGQKRTYVVVSHRCENHVPALAYATRFSFYETILKKAPPHQHFHEQGCCNTLCGGSWGTGCWCCHHGKYAVELSDEEIEKVMAPEDIHNG